MIVQTQATGGDVDAGHHFVLLVDPESLETVAERQVDISAGRYDFSFENVEPGSYLIVAGSDSDNDNVICDAGESCGAYPARDELAPIDVQADMTGADFPTGFSTAFEATSASAQDGGFSRLGTRRIATTP